MRWIWSKTNELSLSARLLMIFVLGLWSAQTLFLLLDTTIEKTLYHRNSKERAIEMFALQVDAVRQSPDVILPVEASIPVSRRSRFWVSPMSLFDTRDITRDAELEAQFLEVLEERGVIIRDLHATYVFGRVPRTPSAARERFSAPRRLPSETYIALRMDDRSDWVNARIASFAAPEAVTSQDLLLSLFAFLLVGGVGIALISRQFSKGLQSLQRAAEDFGRSSAHPSEGIDGPVEFHGAINALNSSRQRVFELIDHKNTMFGAINHELKTPLTSLRLRLEGIEPEEERARAFRTIDEMAHILDEILALARLDHLDGSGDRYDLSAILTDVVTDERARGHQVSLDCKERLVAVIRPGAIRRLLHNVVGNAAVYAGSARITATHDADSVQVVVEDDGPGVPEEAFETMLSPFCRGEQSDEYSPGGAGLGLAIARVIVAGHGGTLTLSNRTPAGLRVEITLPAHLDKTGYHTRSSALGVDAIGDPGWSSWVRRHLARLRFHSAKPTRSG